MTAVEHIPVVPVVEHIPVVQVVEHTPVVPAADHTPVVPAAEHNLVDHNLAGSGSYCYLASGLSGCYGALVAGEGELRNLGEDYLLACKNQMQISPPCMY